MEDVGFTADVKHLGLEVLLEVNQPTTMFDTTGQRNEFIGQVARNPTRVPYGAALAHARAVSFGVWGNTTSLFNDCALIMAAELRRLAKEKNLNLNISDYEVRNSSAFVHAFYDAREHQTAAVHNFVRSLGTNAERMQNKEVREVSQSNDLYARILTELRPELMSKPKRRSSDEYSKFLDDPYSHFLRRL